MVVNKRADGGITALHMAALNGHAESLQLLLDLGACVTDVTVEDGTTIDLIAHWRQCQLHQAPRLSPPAAAKIGDYDGDKIAKDEKVVEEKEESNVNVGKVEENVKMEVEPKTGASFPVKLADGRQLCSLGLRRKKVIALNINIYAFGMYADNAKLKELLKSKFGKAPLKPTKELYEAVIDSDIGMMVRLIIVFRALTMSMVRKNFDEGLGASLKKLNGGQRNDELVNKVMGAASDSIKLSPGSVIEITRLPGYTLQMKVKGELISLVESELLCRAYFNMYLGDDPFDKEAKESFGKSLLTLF